MNRLFRFGAMFLGIVASTEKSHATNGRTLLTGEVRIDG